MVWFSLLCSNRSCEEKLSGQEASFPSPGDVKPPLGSNQLVHGLQVGVDNIKRGSEDIIMEGLKKVVSWNFPLKEMILHKVNLVFK